MGCGTGEHVLMCARRGLDATGIDLAVPALEVAREKARERGLSARFLCHDALRVAELAESFDTVLDCGLFHMPHFTPADRAAYVTGLASILSGGGRYFMLCFSDRVPDDQAGPHRLTRDEITAWFAGRRAWLVDARRTPTANPGAAR